MPLDDDVRYNFKLPGDMRRAAPETYMAMRASGVASAREWCRQAVGEHDALFKDLWHYCTCIDYRLGQALTEAAKMEVSGG